MCLLAVFKILMTAIIFIDRCSSGFDRHRQDWVDNSCPDEVCTWMCVYVFILNLCAYMIDELICSFQRKKGYAMLTLSPLFIFFFPPCTGPLVISNMYDNVF